MRGTERRAAAARGGEHCSSEGKDPYNGLKNEGGEGGGRGVWGWGVSKKNNPQSPLHPIHPGVDLKTL